MKLAISTMACVAAIGFAAPSFAQATTAAKATTSAAKQTSTSAPKTAAPKAAPKSAKPAAMRATGKLTTFDAASMMLTVSTSKGSQQFTLTSATKIEEGSKSIDGAALAKLTGHQVTVTYAEASGQKTVQSVHVSAPAPKKS